MVSVLKTVLGLFILFLIFFFFFFGEVFQLSQFLHPEQFMKTNAAHSNH